MKRKEPKPKLFFLNEDSKNQPPRSSAEIKKRELVLAGFLTSAPATAAVAVDVVAVVVMLMLLPLLLPLLLLLWLMLLLLMLFKMM